MVLAFVCATAAVVVLALAISLINSRGTVAALTLDTRLSWMRIGKLPQLSRVRRETLEIQHSRSAKSPPTKELFPATLEGGN